MPPTGSTFTDWQQVEKESRLLINEDFSWSDPPQRSRRRIADEPIRSARGRARAHDYEHDRDHGHSSETMVAHAGIAERHDDRDRYDGGAHYDVLERYEARSEYESSGTHREFDAYDARARHDVEASRAFVHSPGDRGSWDRPTEVHSHFDEMMEQWNATYGDPAPAAFDLSDPGVLASAQSGRRTVVITGRGDDRYMPAPRRRRSSELRFHERSSFSPDRAGLWAVLLALALLIGSVAH